MQPNDTKSSVRTISHLLFIDVDGRRQVAQAAPNTVFDEANVAAITLSVKPEGFLLAPVSATTATTTVAKETSDRLSLAHLQNVLAGIVPKISDGFTQLGLAVPASRDAIDHDTILTLLRTAVAKAITSSQPTDTQGFGRTTERAMLTSVTGTHKATDGAASLRSQTRVESIDGTPRVELEKGTNSSLQALFVMLHAKGLTAMPDLKSWCEAKKLWPADHKFTPPIRRTIAAELLANIEQPPKIAAGLHESVLPTAIESVAS